MGVKPEMLRSFVVVIVVALGACTFAPLASAQPFCNGASAPFVKNMAPYQGTEPRGMAYVESIDRLLVPDRFGPARYYNRDLMPMGMIPIPGAPGREISGVTWEETTDRLIWVDIGNMQIHHTDVMGNLVTSFVLTDTGTGDWGDIAVEKNWPFPPSYPPKAYLARGSEVFELDAEGNFSGASFTSPGGAGTATVGVDSRDDNRDIQIPVQGGGMACISKVTTSGGPTGGDKISVATLGPPVRGIEFVLFGSDGGKSHYMIMGGSNMLVEVAATDRYTAFIRGDTNADGAADLADAVTLLGRLFGTLNPIHPCADAADANDDGAIDIADAVALLGGLFGSLPLPPLPFPNCGDDTTLDGLDCSNHVFCP